jgi:hypothetical protein
VHILPIHQADLSRRGSANHPEPTISHSWLRRAARDPLRTWASGLRCPNESGL